MLRSRGESGRRWWHAVVLALVLALAVGGVASAGVWGEQTESAPDAVAPPQITIAKETIPAGGGGFEFTLASRGPVLTWGSNGTQPGQFILPTSVTVDGAGNLYVTDAFRIQKFDQRGSFLLQWGSAGSGDGQFNEPDGIAVDSAGNVYVADTFNHRIQKFDSNGVLLTKWGGLGTTDGKFTRPYGVAVSSSGIVYVADTGNNRIQMFDTGGVYQGKWGELGTGDGQFNWPHGIGVDSAGNVYVSERNNHRIQKFDSSGGFLKKWGTQGSGNDQLYQPASLAIDADDDIYVTELQYNRVKKFSNEGAFLAIWQGSGLFSTPYGIATAPGGKFYVADTFNQRIRKFVDASFELDGDQAITYTLDPATFDLSEMVPEHWSLSHVSCNGGQPITTDKGVTLTLQADDDVKCTFVNTADPASLTIAKETDPDGGSGFPFAIRSSLSVLTWGGYGDADGEFSYMGPHGLALDSAGNVYVTDAYHDRIQKFDKNGVFLLTWGTFGYSWHGTGVFYHPRSIAVDSLDKVFVADTNNHRIQVFDTDGNFLTVWGSGPGTGPGEFNFVGDIAFDVNGNIYVADITNHRVQKFDSSLSYVGEWGVSGSGEGEFNNPVGIAVSAEGHVFVVDTGNNRVQKFDTNGNFLGQWGGPGSLPGQFNAPYDVVVNEAGNVYVSDYNNHRLQKFDGDGNLLAVWQGGYYPGMFNFPRGVALDGEGGVYLANANHTVHKLIDLGANIGDDASAQFDLVPGVYSVSELVPDNWSLTGIECNGGNPQRVGDSVNLTLQSADDITCSFTNTADPGRITIVKEVVGQAPAEEWQFTGDLGGFTLPAAGGQTTFDNVPFGQYSVAEQVEPDFIQSVVCDSGESGAGSITVDLQPGEEVTCIFTNTERNQPPAVEAGGPYEVPEGGTIGVMATGTDPESAPLTYEWDLDNDGVFETPGQAATFSAALLDGPTSAVIAARVTDPGGLSAVDWATVDVSNLPPVVGAINAPIDPVQIGASVDVSAIFSDPCPTDTFTAVWDWGDLTSSPGTISDLGGQVTVNGNHVYSSAGIYSLKLTVTDDDGGAGMESYRYVVVYDPNGGFVTGGGWIWSPAGAYAADPGLSGKASFGFVAKYKKGAHIPDGNTQFQFRAAGLQFESTNYDWLVIAGPQAKFKGSGTINGASEEYGFMLTALDGQVKGGDGVDRFRIKIWEPVTDQIIYDNQMGEADDAAPSTGLGGGSIVIHK